MLLILTNSKEQNVAKIIDSLNYFGTPYYRLNVDLLSYEDISFDYYYSGCDEAVKIKLSGLDLTKVTVVFERKFDICESDQVSKI